MIVEVNAKHIKDLFTDFVKNSKVMFNFKCDGNIIDVQVLGEYTACTKIPCKSLDNDFTPKEVSFWASKSVFILMEDSPIKVTINDAVCYLEQGNSSFTAIKEYESRRDFPDMSGEELKSAYANRLKYLAHSAISCIPLARELSKSYPDPMFSFGRMYLNFRQTMYVDNIDYPPCCITMSTFRDFAFKLHEKTVYKYIPDLDTLYFKSDKYEFWVPTSNYNLDGATISGVDKILKDCVDITTICIKDEVDKLSIISGAFPKQKMTLSIGDGIFNVCADATDSHVVVGPEIQNFFLSIYITSAQLDVIVKLFKEEDEIKVLRGANCICLSSKEKKLLIAGMVY